MITSFAFFFFLLSSYFVLRPIRDAVAAATGINKMPWLFAGTLAGTLICNPLFSGLIVRFPVRKVIPISYHFFALSFVAFYAVLRFVAAGETSTAGIWMQRIFFVWITVFALFNTSIFWCLMADVFRSEQAKRMFGFIGVGGTIGSIAGSAATAALAPHIGAVNMLLVSAGLIEMAILVVVVFPMSSHGTADRGVRGGRDPDVIGGSVWAGFTEITKSRYLLGICAFQVFYVFGSTVLYIGQAVLVGRLYSDLTARTTILAQLELAAQVLTVFTQMFLTGRIIRWIGMAATLAVLPAMGIIGFTALGLVPLFRTVAAFTVLRRAANFALTNPAVEVLFTVVPREDKYKAKNVIETFVYRAGDQVAAWAYAGLATIGLTLAGISYVAVPISAVWFGLAIWLGRRQAVMAANDAPAEYVHQPLIVEPSGQPT